MKHIFNNTSTTIIDLTKLVTASHNKSLNYIWLVMDGNIHLKLEYEGNDAANICAEDYALFLKRLKN
jgi:hypothetical protein